MTYLPHRIWVQTHEADEWWGSGFWGGRMWQPE
jgi:hypothetical protein